MACNIAGSEKSGYKSVYRKVNNFVKSLMIQREKIKIKKEQN